MTATGTRLIFGDQNVTVGIRICRSRKEIRVRRTGLLDNVEAVPENARVVVVTAHECAS